MDFQIPESNKIKLYNFSKAWLNGLCVTTKWTILPCVSLISIKPFASESVKIRILYRRKHKNKKSQTTADIKK